MLSTFIYGFLLFVKISLHISKDIEIRLGYINRETISNERLNKSCGRV